MCILIFIEQVNYSFMHMIPLVKDTKKLLYVIYIGVCGGGGGWRSVQGWVEYVSKGWDE